MLFTTSHSPDSKKLTSNRAHKLWKCDLIRTYKECGWFHARGYEKVGEGRRLVIHVHCKSCEEFRKTMKSQCTECGPHHDHLTSELIDREYYNKEKGKEECKALDKKVRYTP